MGLNQMEKDATAALTKQVESKGESKSPRHITKRQIMADETSDNGDMISATEGEGKVKRAGSEQSLNFNKADMKS